MQSQMEPQMESWTIIYLLNGITSENLQTVLHFYQCVGHNLSKVVRINKCFYYFNLDISPELAIMSVDNTFFCCVNEFNRLDIISKHYLDCENIIFFSNGEGYVDVGSPNIIMDSTFETCEVSTKTTQRQCQCLQTQCQGQCQPTQCLPSRTINSNILIMKYNQSNLAYVNRSIENYNSYYNLQPDDELAANLALTVSAIELDKNVNTISSKQFINLNEDKNYNHYNEQCLLVQSQMSTRSIILPSQDYIYYPFYDFDGARTIADNTNTVAIVNSGGFTFGSKLDCAYSKFYRRFDNKNEGLYVLKDGKRAGIPTIIHHIWSCSQNEMPHPECVNKWKKLLRNPWTYQLWDEDAFEENIDDPFWRSLYSLANDHYIKMLIVKFAILEKYGGIVVEFCIDPIKLFPRYVLNGNFMIAFAGHASPSSAVLSYRVMGSLPGLIVGDQIIDPMIARIPFEGQNNFFKKIILQNKIAAARTEIQSESENAGVDVALFLAIRSILCSISSCTTSTILNNLDDLLLNYPSATILPEYFFNPALRLAPRKFLSEAICVPALQELGVDMINEIVEEAEVEAELEAELMLDNCDEVSQRSINASLTLDPVDLLRNLKKI